MATFRELLSATKAEIREVDTAEADELRTRPGTVLLDVREIEEYEQGAVPGSIHITRGHLESKVEGRVPDKDTPLLVLCAGGTRSAFAAKTLEQLGYTDVVSVAGGFNRWKDEGRDWATPRSLTA
ncbi:MAG: molybdopterin biosynthesis protein MoeB, partial [Acidimicrobiales bacterium]|nr:molybdopterin biosynthesis protein MoeB [Acidimicrobiales bacterium]